LPTNAQQRRSFDSSKASPFTATSQNEQHNWSTATAPSTSQPNDSEPLCFSHTSVETSEAAEQPESCVDEGLSVASLSCAAESSLYSSEASQKDHNSVTIKSDTSVKDAAGAICKVLNRLASTFVTALQLDNSHEAANRAVKALAVSRKYIKDAATGHELGFYPLNRTNLYGEEDPNLFAFLAFKTLLAPGVELKDHDKTDLNVSTSSDPNKIANAIICIVKERGQAIMKAGGGNALHVAMTAVINARRRLKRSHSLDLMLVPQWITENTMDTLGRESKFLRMNILRSGLNGVSVNPNAALSPV